MSATWFEIITAKGKQARPRPSEKHVGVVQGSGGKIGYSFSHLEKAEREAASLARLEKAIDRATKGEDTGLFEPEPGHCALYPHYCNAGDGDYLAIPLAGATARVVEPRRFGSWCQACATRNGVRVLSGFVGEESACELCGRRSTCALVEKWPPNEESAT